VENRRRSSGNNLTDAAFVSRVRIGRGYLMAYRQLIGDAALIATLGFMAAIIAGAF
jgi:hypothetical protein